MRLYILIVALLCPCRSDPIWRSGLLNDQLNATLAWSFNDTVISFVVSAKADGYVAIGISPDGHMPNSYVVIGAVTDTNSWVEEYKTLGHHEQGVQQTSRNLLKETLAKHQDGQTTIMFSRAIQDDIYPIRTDKMINMIWALHETSSIVIPHTSQGSVAVNLATGDLQYTPNPPPGITMHGLLMFLAFGCIIPISVLIARFSESDHRIRQHRGLQILAILVICGAFSLAIVHVKHVDDQHFNAKHRQLGLVVVIIALVNAIIGPISSCAGNGRQYALWSWIHFLLGRIIFVLGPITIFSGLLTYHEVIGLNVSPFLSIHVAVTIIIWMVAIVLQVRKYAKQRQFISVPDSPRR